MYFALHSNFCTNTGNNGKTMNLLELNKAVKPPKSINTTGNLTFKNNAADILFEYFEHSSVHGIRYIARRSSNIFER